MLMDASVHKYFVWKDGYGRKLNNGQKHMQYYVSYRYVDGKTGKKKQKIKKGFRNEKEARIFIGKLVHEMENRIFIPDTGLKVDEYISRWLEIKKDNVEYNTYAGYVVNVNNHIIPRIGKIRIQELKKSDIEAFYSKMKKDDYSPRTVRYVHSVLKLALDSAVEDEIIKKNPASKISIKKEDKKKTYNVYSSAEINEAIKISENSIFYASIVLAGLLGLRRGEVLGLTWNNIDFVRKEFTINIQANYISKTEVGFCKLKNCSIRTIKLSESLVTVLKKHEKFCKTLRLKYGLQSISSNLLFFDETGGFIDPKWFSKEFSKFLKNNELRKIRFHDLRHSAATNFLKQGMSLYKVSKILGHSHFSVTDRHYGHLKSSDIDEVLDYIDDAISL
jgi:integrase